MQPAVSYVTSGFAATDSAGRNVAVRVAVVALLHAAAVGVCGMSQCSIAAPESLSRIAHFESRPLPFSN
jgi:hypothetical protein